MTVLHLEKLVIDFITAKEMARSLLDVSQNSKNESYYYCNHYQERQPVVIMELANFKTNKEE